MFEPYNRHLLLEKVEEQVEEKQSTILVPDDYKVKTSPYGWYNVLSAADDCSHDLKGRTILVNESMVEEISINKKKYYLVLENYIYGMRE